MPVTKIEFGKPFQRFDIEQLRDGITNFAGDCFLDSDDSYVKRPGLTTFGTLPVSAAVDGLYETIGGSLMAVCQGNLYSVNASGSATAITGTGLSTGNYCTFAEDRLNVYMAHRGTNLLQVASGLNSYSALSASGHPVSASHLIYLQGHLLCNPQGQSAGSAAVVAGDVAFNNLSTYPGSGWRVFNNEAVADSCTALYTIWDEVLSFGPRSVETSYNNGTTPWAVSNAPPLDCGTLASYSAAIVAGELYWLGVLDGSPRILVLKKRTPIPISSPIDGLLASLTSLSTGTGSAVTYNGQVFYLITFPADDISLAYNLATKSWTQWGAWSGSVRTELNHRTALYWKAQNKMLIGSGAADGKIWKLTGNTDNGSAIYFSLKSGNVSHGTDRRKRCKDIRVKWRSTNAANTFRLQWKDEGGAFHSEVTVGPDNYVDDIYFATINRLGKYRERQWHIIHDNTSYPFSFVSLEENFEVLAI